MIFHYVQLKLWTTGTSVTKFCISLDLFLPVPMTRSRIHFLSIIQLLHVAFRILTERETELLHFSPSPSSSSSTLTSSDVIARKTLAPVILSQFHHFTQFQYETHRSLFFYPHLLTVRCS